MRPRADRDALARLVRAAAEGNAAATRELLEHLAASILRVVRAVLGAAHPDVEDAFQEALLGLVTSLPAFRNESGVRHYACRIALRIALAARRRARDRRTADVDHDGVELEGEMVIDAHEAVRAARRGEALRSLLEELPEAQAVTLVLRVVLGFTMQEVADATGTPLNTVRSRLRLAKEALVRRIGADAALAEELEVTG
jgi:RNA polymerase sigma-70 factor (ECF subfamily)